ncbi:MAG: cysteine desulfurase family protein [Bacteroidota bacterium]
MKKGTPETIYLDSHASTRVDQAVLKSMLPYFTQHYANGNHKAGWKSNTAVEEARFQVASFIGARPSEVIFTSGATESVNLGILGFADERPTKRNQIITQQTEHSAVLACMKVLQQSGYQITFLEVDVDGRIDLEELKEVVSDKTLLVAIMLANNEIGTVQPVKAIGEICRKVGAKFFCDLTQVLGWHRVDVDEMNIDLAAFSAHKVYGPRGVGGLFVRRKGAKIKLRPLLVGGGQENGLRSGTLNVPGIVGLGKAIERLTEHGATDFQYIQMLRDRLQEQLFAAIKGIKLNGCPPTHRHPANLNIAIPKISGEQLIGALPNIIFSTGSACTSASVKPSHVLTALGAEDWVLKNALRFGISKYNTIEEIDFVTDQIIQKAGQCIHI